MAEVFLHNKSYVFTCVVSTPNTKIKHRGIMKGQKISSCVVIKSTLQQLRTKLFNEGFALGKLLEAKYPGADAVLSAVEKIKFLLEDHPVDICGQWVTAHVVVGDKKKFISNCRVLKVSIFLLFLLLLCLICICITNLVLLR